MSEELRENVETTEEQKVDKVDNQQGEVKQGEIKTFTQDEIDEMVKSNVDRAVAKALHKADEQRKEAEKLAAMNAKEKAEYELNKKRQDIEERERNIQLRELTAEAKDILIEKGLSSDLASILDYKDAESVKESINIIESAINKEAEKQVIERLKGRTPKTKNINSAITKEEIEKIEENDITQSMLRKGNCLDNSPMENFFGILKQEIYYGNKFYSYEHLNQTIEDYIKYYNEERIKEKLGYLSPVEYKKKNAA